MARSDFRSTRSRFAKILGGLLSLLVLSLVITSAALATTIYIHPTGEGLTTAGQQDNYWTVGGNPAQLLTPSAPNWYTYWLANGPISQWIGVTANNTGNGYGYTYQYTFDLSSFTLSSVSLAGAWAIDDAGDLLVNGNVISTLGGGNWGQLTNFGLVAGSGYLNPGLNTLGIHMTSTDNYLEGARLQMLITGDLNPVPEPCTILLLGSGLAGLAGFRRRFKRS